MMKNSKCVVPYCGHAQQHNKQCIYARFPKNLERCRLWVQLAGVEALVHLKPETLHKIRYICGCHFTDDQFSNETRKRLKRSAVPSIFDQQVVPLLDSVMIDFAPFVIDAGEQPIVPIENSGTLLAAETQFVSAPSIYNDSVLPGVIDAQETIDREHASVNDDNSNTSRVEAPVANPSKPILKRYRPSVAVQRMTKKKLMEICGGDGSKPTKRESRIIKLIQKQSAEFRNKLQSLKKCNDPLRKLSADRDYDDLVRNIAAPALREIVLGNIRNNQRPLQGRRWTLDEKRIALSIYKRGPRAYSYLQHIIQLPSKRTIIRSMKTIPVQTGIIEQALEDLKGTVTAMSEVDKRCVVLFDEMALNI